MSKPRAMDDGTLQFPKQGRTPPALQAGYEYDKSNPWIQRPILFDCPLRQKNEAVVPCNRSPTGLKIIVHYTCEANKPAGYMQCMECKAFGEQEKLLGK